MLKLIILIYFLNNNLIYCLNNKNNNKWCSNIPCKIGNRNNKRNTFDYFNSSHFNTNNNLNFCSLKLLLLIIPNNEKLNEIIQIINQLFLTKQELQSYSYHRYINQEIFFNISQIYSKLILYDKKKHLEAFKHKNINYYMIFQSFQSILISLIDSSRLSNHFSHSNRSSDRMNDNNLITLNNSNFFSSTIFIINSTIYFIKLYDQLHEIFPCSRVILLQHPLTERIQFYIQKFYSMTLILTNQNYKNRKSLLENWFLNY